MQDVRQAASSRAGPRRGVRGESGEAMPPRSQGGLPACQPHNLWATRQCLAARASLQACSRPVVREHLLLLAVAASRACLSEGGGGSTLYALAHSPCLGALELNLCSFSEAHFRVAVSPRATTRACASTLVLSCNFMLSCRTKGTQLAGAFIAAVIYRLHQAALGLAQRKQRPAPRRMECCCAARVRPLCA